MNIIIKPYGLDRCYCRPDTTWERENRDFYSPDCVDTLCYTPILFARISKAGKCVSEKFASRYYDAVNFGTLLYIGDFLEDGRCLASCCDHTSLLPAPLYNPVTLNGDNSFILEFNGNRICEKAVSELEAGIIDKAISKASELTSLRIGDFIAIELSEIQELTTRKEGVGQLKATYCDNELFDFKIIF